MLTQTGPIITVGQRTKIRAHALSVRPFVVLDYQNVFRKKVSCCLLFYVVLVTCRRAVPAQKKTKGRQFTKATFDKWQKEHEREYRTLTWLRCGRQSSRIKFVVRCLQEIREGDMLSKEFFQLMDQGVCLPTSSSATWLTMLEVMYTRLLCQG